MDKLTIGVLFASVVALFVLTMYDNAFHHKPNKYVESSGWLKVKAPDYPEKWATMPAYHDYCLDCLYRAPIGDECGISYECEAPDGCSYEVPADYDYYKE